ncbi:MAG: GumC family protein [Bryobacteraceae bacterium]
MQPHPDYLAVPRRELDVEDYIDILRRHWMWIAGPAYAGLVIAVVVAFFWPDTFISYATMRITPAQVSERIVPTNFNLQLNERLQTMHQDVTSRAKLIDMIKKFNLYPRDQRKKPIEDIVEIMREKIRIEPVTMHTAGPQILPRTGGTAFRISYAYETRMEAHKVVNEIISSFTSQNVLDRRSKSRITTEFLSEELRTAKADLDRIEGELTQFKLRNAGSLPDELQTNLQTMRSYEVQLQNVQEALNRAQQEKLMLETNIQNYRNQLETVVTTIESDTAVAKNERLVELERVVLRLETEINVMKETYRAEHPDVISRIKQLDAAKNERDRLAQVEDKVRQGSAPRRVSNPVAIARRGELEASGKSTQSRIAAIDMDMAERAKTQRQLLEQLRVINARIMANPLTVGEFARLSRDYNLAKQKYDDLNNKKSSAEVANRLEDRSAGENLEQLDPASLPLKPSEPQRWVIVGAGLGIGLVMGLFLAGAQEVKDTTMKGLKDVRAYSKLNILSSIPLLENALLVRRKRRLTWLAWSSSLIVGIVVMSGSIYYYFSFR